MIDILPVAFSSPVILHGVPPLSSYLTSADLTFIAAAKLKSESLKGKHDFAFMLSVKLGDLSRLQSTLSLTYCIRTLAIQ